MQGMVELEQRLQQQAAALEAQRAQQAEQWAEYEVQRARLAQLVLDRSRLDELVRCSRASSFLWTACLCFQSLHSVTLDQGAW